MCVNVLEYQSNPDAMMKDIKHVMHNDSWLYIEIPYNEDPNYDVFHEHLNFWNLKSFEIFLDKFGLKIVDQSITDMLSLLVRLK